MSAERDAVSACVTCQHRAIWHHDERGCQYLGNSAANRCPCLQTSDEVVAQIVATAMQKAADETLQLDPPLHDFVGGTRRQRRGLDREQQARMFPSVEGDE